MSPEALGPGGGGSGYVVGIGKDQGMGNREAGLVEIQEWKRPKLRKLC